MLPCHITTFWQTYHILLWNYRLIDLLFQANSTDQQPGADWIVSLLVKYKYRTISLDRHTGLSPGINFLGKALGRDIYTCIWYKGEIGKPWGRNLIFCHSLWGAPPPSPRLETVLQWYQSPPKVEPFEWLAWTACLVNTSWKFLRFCSVGVTSQISIHYWNMMIEEIVFP